MTITTTRNASASEPAVLFTVKDYQGYAIEEKEKEVKAENVERFAKVSLCQETRTAMSILFTETKDILKLELERIADAKNDRRELSNAVKSLNADLRDGSITKDRAIKAMKVIKEHEAKIEDINKKFAINLEALPKPQTEKWHEALDKAYGEYKQAIYLKDGNKVWARKMNMLFPLIPVAFFEDVISLVGFKESSRTQKAKGKYMSPYSKESYKKIMLSAVIHVAISTGNMPNKDIKKAVYEEVKKAKQMTQA